MPKVDSERHASWINVINMLFSFNIYLCQFVEIYFILPQALNACAQRVQHANFMAGLSCLDPRMYYVIHQSLGYDMHSFWVGNCQFFSKTHNMKGVSLSVLFSFLRVWWPSFPFSFCPMCTINVFCACTLFSCVSCISLYHVIYNHLTQYSVYFEKG